MCCWVVRLFDFPPAPGWSVGSSFNIKVSVLDLNSHNHHCVILSVPGEQGDVYHIWKETAAVTLEGQNFNKAVLI